MDGSQYESVSSQTVTTTIAPSLTIIPPSTTETKESHSAVKSPKLVADAQIHDDLQHSIKALIDFIASR